MLLCLKCYTFLIPSTSHASIVCNKCTICTIFSTTILYYMRLITTIILIVSISSIRAQKARPLTIGDTIPDLTLHDIINYKDSVIRLSDFKDKLLVLDYFATWCTGCIASFPNMESLQLYNKNKIQIFIVSKPNDDSLSSLKRFLEKSLANTGRPIPFPIIAMDTIISKYFPHRIIPHTIWIRNNKVVAITHSKALNQQSINLAFDKGIYEGDLKPE